VSLDSAAAGDNSGEARIRWEGCTDDFSRRRKLPGICQGKSRPDRAGSLRQMLSTTSQWGRLLWFRGHVSRGDMRSNLGPLCSPTILGVVELFQLCC